MKQTGFQRRKNRVRHKLASVSNATHRISVHCTNQHIYVQLIDDSKGQTLASASSLKVKDKLSGIAMAEKVGSIFAEGVKKVKAASYYFDRGGKLYHGRIKALADAARAGGLKF